MGVLLVDGVKRRYLTPDGAAELLAPLIRSLRRGSRLFRRICTMENACGAR